MRRVVERGDVMRRKNKVDYDSLKAILSTEEGLGIVCYIKHHHKGPANCSRLSEILKVPVSRLKETCVALEATGAMKTIKTGQDMVIEMQISEDDRAKELIDEVIWKNKQEYGKIYKKLITAELLDFMDGK